MEPNISDAGPTTEITADAEQIASPSPTEVALRVAEALLEDLDTGAVRIDSDDMERVGLLPGDIIEVTGKRSTVGRVLPMPPGVRGRALIRLDGTLRENAQAGLDERVTIRRVPTPPAETLLLTPEEGNGYGPREIARLRDLLAGLPTVVGDKIKAVLYGRRGHFFRVAATAPVGPVVIGPYTDLRLKAPEVASKERPFKVKYEDIGGLEAEVRRIREM
ncbi:MAG: hypothetical protein ACYC1C_13165, partial [Chloroflexota bacterium]